MRFLFLALIGAMMIYNSCGNTTNYINVNNSEMTKDQALLRHVVLFNFKDSADENKVAEIESAFASLASSIDEIKDFEWGTNNSPEGLDKGLTHCFFVTFHSEEDRDAYLPHPEHQKFVELVGPYVEDVTVLDYWVK